MQKLLLIKEIYQYGPPVAARKKESTLSYRTSAIAFMLKPQP